MIRISELPEANSIGNNDQLILDQVDGVTKKVLVSTVRVDINSLLEEEVRSIETNIFGEYNDFQVLEPIPFIKDIMRYYNPEDNELKKINYIICDGTYLDGTVYKKIYQHLLDVYEDPTIRPEISVKDKDLDEYTDYDYVLNRLGRYFRMPIKFKKEYRLFKDNLVELEALTVNANINQLYTMPESGILIFAAIDVPNQSYESDFREGASNCQGERGILIQNADATLIKAIDARVLTYNSSQARVPFFCSTEVYKGEQVNLRHLFNPKPTFKVYLIKNTGYIYRIFIGGYKENE